MSYEPTNWKTGDVVTSAKLNKLENGVADAGGVLAVHSVYEDENRVLDKTWNEIYIALNAGCYVSIVDDGGQNIIYEAVFDDRGGGFMINAYSLSDGTSLTYTANSGDGYPSMGQ